MVLLKISRIMLGLFLGIQGITDYRKRHISLVALLLGLTCGIGVAIISKDSPMTVLLNIAIGLIFIAASVMSKGALGYGDGLVVIVAGLIVGFKFTALMVMISGLVSSLYAMYLLIIKRYRGSTSFPYIPFLIPAFLLTIMMETL